MNEELQKYIEALRRHAGGAKYIQLSDSNGNLSSPMSIEEAALYLYSGNSPEVKLMPSELITERLDRQWASREAQKLVDAARTRANEYNTRSFYTDVALPTLTLGLSKFIPGLEGTTNAATGPLSAAVLSASRNPIAGRLLWPAAAATAAWGWYANTHEPPTMPRFSRFDAIEERDETPVASPTNTGTTLSPATPSPENNNEDNDSTKNKKFSFRDLLWRRSGKPSSGRLSQLKPSRATVENYGVRLPLYTGVAAPVVDLGLNAIGRAYTPDSIPYTMKFPVTKARFALETGILGLLGDAYKDTAPLDTARTSNNTPVTVEGLPEGFRPIQGINDSTGQIVVPNSAGQTDSVITIEPITRNRFGRGDNQNQ